MEHCDGCCGGCRKGYKYHDHIEREDIYCPCGVCLVKVLCNTTCEDYSKYYSGRIASTHYRKRK